VVSDTADRKQPDATFEPLALGRMRPGKRKCRDPKAGFGHTASVGLHLRAAALLDSGGRVCERRRREAER